MEFGSGNNPSQFGSGYTHSMDREHAHDHGHHGFPSDAPKATSDLGIRIGDLGTSFGLGPVPNVQAIQSRLRPGAKKLEFTFTGMGKGSGQGQTPGMYGKRQRQAIVEMGKANKIDFTTHSTVGIYGLSGMEQQGGFSKARKANSIQELKRAIEFAADVGFGGPVVVHTGEFDRPIVDADWNKQKEDHGKFEMFEGEAERSSYRVVDSRSGSLISEARRNRKVSRPVWMRAKEDDPSKDIKKGDFINYFGEKVGYADKVPEYDEDTGSFKIRQLSWEDLEEESVEMTKRFKQDFKRWDSMSDEEKKKSIWSGHIERAREAGLTENQLRIKPEEAYIITTLETNAGTARGWALQYAGDFQEMVKRAEKLKGALAYYKKLEETMDKEELWRLRRQEQPFSEFIPPETKNPTQIIEKQLKQIQHTLKHHQEASAAQMTQAEESMETIRHVESAETYAIREACDAYARSAINAMHHTDKLRKEGKLKRDRPLSVALENLFPEHYGSHPDEIMKLVKQSRARMQELLQNQGFSQEQAKQKAVDHITSTFDTGHMNMWRKYWKGDKDKSIEQNNADFEKWLLGKVEKMAKEKVIGHVHIDDNYGYHDDHLAPGEGNTPIKQMLKILKKHGYPGDLIVEPGADFYTDTGNGFQALAKTWRHFDLPVYGAASGLAGQGRTWNHVQYGQFGWNQPAYFTFGAYSPSEEWTLWSGVPLE